ncbi:MAG: SLBB domain-containing protein [Pseudomonadota bacterium]|uniref:polysaccharide biosynthesis/export family protein n=1 Tax=Sphingomonas sp. ERG5 TaxID=1381597 RepID=UPI00126A03E4|nr:SLBB domain-containing protein [Sphingomonas sp. ERG5]
MPSKLPTLPALRLIIASSALGVLASCAPPLHYAPAPTIAMERPSLDIVREVNAKLEDHFALNGDFHPNDLIRLSFPYAPLLTSEQRVQLSGLISPPLLSPIQTKGLTVSQLQAKLITLYRPKLKEPSVAISVLEYNRPPPQPEIFVLGEVQKPGAYPYRDGISLYEGLARSGGGNRDADLRRVVLLQPVDDHMVARMVDLQAVLTGESASLGYLSPFSILIVPPTKIARDVDRARQIRAIIGFNGVTIGSSVTLLQ